MRKALLRGLAGRYGAFREGSELLRRHLIVSEGTYVLEGPENGLRSSRRSWSMNCLSSPFKALRMRSGTSEVGSAKGFEAR